MRSIVSPPRACGERVRIGPAGAFKHRNTLQTPACRRRGRGFEGAGRPPDRVENTMIRWLAHGVAAFAGARLGAAAEPRIRPWDVQAIRRHFLFPAQGRVVTNNAASTQPPVALLRLHESLAPAYENVHRGQSDASRVTTERFEAAYDDIARFVGAAGRAGVVVVRNTTEAHNLVMYSLMSEFRDGDNVVTTLMEHNSNFVPWHAMCRDILPRFGRRVQCRLARFDPATGELDLAHLASLVDARTKLVCCTGASNFLGTRNALDEVRRIARASGYAQPDGGAGSRLLVDGAQLVPGQFIDMQAMDIDYLSFSFHKMLAPFGVGALVAKPALLEASLPFLYGGDMIAEGQVFPDRVAYNALPWKFAAGTPHILGTIVAAQALRLLVDLALTPEQPNHYASPQALDRADVQVAMGRIGAWNRTLTARALERLAAIPGLTIYGPRDPARRSALVAFNVAGRNPMELARGLNERGVESRAGCHCANLAHRALGLDPPASCRLSFYLYNTLDEVDRAVDALREVVAPRTLVAVWAGRSRQPAPAPAGAPAA
jgi:cysteine desulfurase/selenocysteine lyase